MSYWYGYHDVYNPYDPLNWRNPASPWFGYHMNMASCR
jgi:hypothetical protein